MTMTWSRTHSPTTATTAEVAAFEALFQQHWQRICNLLFHITGDWHAAEDLALETFMRLYEQPPADVKNLGGWLYRVATNQGLNALRARQRRQRYEAQASQEADPSIGLLDPAVAVEQAQERQQVRAVLAKLKPRSAQILLLRYCDLSYQEIANVLEIAPGSVGTLLARAEKEFADEYRRSGA